MALVRRVALGLRRSRRCRWSSTVSAPGVDASGTTFNGVFYPRDSLTNVPPSILSFVPRALFLQPNHPIATLRALIEGHFGPTFQSITSFPPIVTPQQNFDELDFPADHPGRSPSDSYYLNKDWMLRTHTSAHEVQVFRAGIPRWLLTADVYRRDEIDRSHYPIFHQMEGAKVVAPDEMDDLSKENEQLRAELDASNIQVEDLSTINETNPWQEWHKREHAELVNANLKHSINSVIYGLFGGRAKKGGEPLQVRWIDAYFPWTSPSYEVEVFFDGKWLEILGSGVVQQAALTRSAVPKDRVGWAFGLGLERIAMILFNIADIRLFWSQDPRFLQQFEAGKVTKFKPFSKYPACWRDISFWIGEKPFHLNDMCDIVRDVAGNLAEEIIEVDKFTHPETGRQSMTFRINYRSMEKSLTNEEANTTHNDVKVKLAPALGVEVR